MSRRLIILCACILVAFVSSTLSVANATVTDLAIDHVSASGATAKKVSSHSGAILAPVNIEDIRIELQGKLSRNRTLEG